MDAFEATEITPDDAEPEPALRILVANEQSTLAIDEARLQSAVRSVLDESSYDTGLISIAVVDDATIHVLNRQYLDHDYPTDVLSFALEAAGSHLEGELVISADAAAREAGQFGWAPFDELLLYAIHGALHLVGYLDKEPAAAAAMRAAEAGHLRKVGVSLPTSQERWLADSADVAIENGAPKS